MSKKIHIKPKEIKNSQVIGIASHQSYYRLAWNINKILGINLIKDKDYTLNNSKEDTYISFPVFTYKDSNNILFILIPNKSENRILSIKYKNIDFFLIITNGDFAPAANEIYKKLNKSEIILGYFVLETDKSLKKLIDSYTL